MNAQARDAVREEVERWAVRLRVCPTSVHVRPMVAKWASCSRAGRLSLSSDLLRQGRSFRDAVIVHELLHLRIPNHGRLFKSLMSAYLPDWRKRLGEACPSSDRATPRLR